MITKTADSKGRINFGKHFANKTFIVEQVGETEIRLEIARVIPEREAWLYQNPEAKESLLKGLRQAKARQFSKSPPDLTADQALVDGIEDSE
ncbi:MAG: hypothetical protein V2B18_18870 [Pseudomonadota bacterium]